MSDNETQKTVDELLAEYVDNPNAETFEAVRAAAFTELTQPVTIATGETMTYNHTTHKFEI